MERKAFRMSFALPENMAPGQALRSQLALDACAALTQIVADYPDWRPVALETPKGGIEYCEIGPMHGLQMARFMIYWEPNPGRHAFICRFDVLLDPPIPMTTPRPAAAPPHPSAVLSSAP